MSTQADTSDTNVQRNPPAEMLLIPASDRERAAPRWQELEYRLHTATLSNSWPWVQAWLNSYGHIPHTFVFKLVRGETIGAALLTHGTFKVGPFPVPSLFLGTAGEPLAETTYVQYNRLLVAPNDLHEFVSSLVRTMKRFRWWQLRLNGMVYEHADALTSRSISNGLPFRIEAKPAPTFNFARAAEQGHTDVIQALGESTRYSIRRSMRLFDKSLGERSVEWAETTEQAKDILQELIDLHEDRWNDSGHPGAFHSPRVRQYHHDLIDALLPRNSLIVFRVRQGRTTIGCLFNFVEDGHVSAYKCGFPRFQGDNRLKPGLVTHALCMQECRQRGLLEYDFLSGNVPYKRQLSNSENRLYWCTAERGPGMKVVAAVRDLHHHPVVQSWESRVRQLVRVRGESRDRASEQ